MSVAGLHLKKQTKGDENEAHEAIVPVLTIFQASLALAWSIEEGEGDTSPAYGRAVPCSVEMGHAWRLLITTSGISCRCFCLPSGS